MRSQNTHRVIDHTADTGIEAVGETPAACAEQAAQGFIEMSFGNLRPEQKSNKRTFTCREDTPEDLIVELLRELLLSIQINDMRIDNVTVLSMSETGLEAEIHESPLTDESEIIDHIKAVTYHGLNMERTEQGLYTVRIIFDI